MKKWIKTVVKTSFAIVVVLLLMFFSLVGYIYWYYKIQKIDQTPIATIPSFNITNKNEQKNISVVIPKTGLYEIAVVSDQKYSNNRLNNKEYNSSRDNMEFKCSIKITRHSILKRKIEKIISCNEKYKTTAKIPIYLLVERNGRPVWHFKNKYKKGDIVNIEIDNATDLSLIHSMEKLNQVSISIIFYQTYATK